MPGSNGVILVDCTGNRRLSREVYPSKISKDLFQRSDSLETANERWCETIFKQLRTVTSYLQPCTFYTLLYWIGTCRWWTVCASDLQDFMSQCQLQCCVQEAFSRFAAVAPGLYASKQHPNNCWTRGMPSKHGMATRQKASPAWPNERFNGFVGNIQTNSKEQNSTDMVRCATSSHSEAGGIRHTVCKDLQVKQDEPWWHKCLLCFVLKAWTP